MDPLPPSDPALRHPLLRHAAAHFGVGLAHVHYRRRIERAQRLMAENARLREVTYDLFDARLVHHPDEN
jgi:hypothetical protein